MKKSTIVNILIAGTGGQGVQTLSNWLRKMAINKGYTCVGATFKGGAQRMGSVYTELRIQTNPVDLQHFSSQIPLGEVHVLIALEPWEALRFAKRCNAETKVIVHTAIQSLYAERFQKNELINPVDTVLQIFDEPILKEYKKDQFLNKLLLEDTIKHEFLPFDLTDFKRIIDEL